MRCPACAHPESKVVDSRTARDAAAVRRRRECERCGRRFTTHERPEEEMPLVVKKDGRREPYDRHKVVSGMRRACEKRPVPAAMLDRIADQLERMLVDSGEREVESRRVGEWVMERLREIDGVAYVRFASVYRQFKDISEFMDELRGLLDSRGLPLDVAIGGRLPGDAGGSTDRRGGGK
ncbi:MAG: transcriptional regulator NrdR [Myxococcota bacterium]|nr:transcriptional regulator NrdR [Myxococcota bacterium]